MSDSPVLSAGENTADAKSNDRKNATWSFSSKNSSPNPNKVFTVDDGGNKKLWLYKENIFEISEEPMQSTRQKLAARHSGEGKPYNHNALKGMQRNRFGQPTLAEGMPGGPPNDGGRVTFDNKDPQDLYRSSSLVNIADWRETCREKVRVRPQAFTVDNSFSMPPNNLAEFQRDRLSRRCDRSPVNPSSLTNPIGVPAVFTPQHFEGGEFDRLDRQYASIQPRRSAPQFSASEFNPSATTSWGRRNPHPSLPPIYSPLTNNDLFQYRSVFPYTTLHYPTRRHLYKRSGSASTKHGKAHQFHQHALDQRNYFNGGTFETPTASNSANYHSIRLGNSGQRESLAMPRRPTSYPSLPASSPRQQPPPQLQIYDIFDDSANAPTSALSPISPFYDPSNPHNNHHQQHINKNPGNFSIPVGNLNAYASNNSSQTLNPSVGNMELPLARSSGRFGGTMMDNGLATSFTAVRHHRQLMSLPSELSSGFSEDGMCQRRCIIGWVIGLTALIIVALAIALFIQVSKDAAISRKQRIQLLDEYYGGAEEIKL